MPDYDVAIIGAGPGGYVAAIRAAQLGLRAALIERDQVGGLCLNWGCIPSKALLYAAELLNLFRRGPEFGIAYEGLSADLGVAVDRSREIVARFVAGVDAIGVEFPFLYRSYGSAVTIVELLPRLLPGEDEDVSRQLERSFAGQGISVRAGARVDAVRVGESDVTLSVVSGDKTEELRAERLLVGVGFEANSGGLGLEEIGVELERGFIKVDDYCRTSVPGVWAIGDVTGKLQLAHVAAQQGVTVVETIAGREPPPLDYERMPRAVYCQPQVASLGLTEAQAKERGFKVRGGRFPFRANGKAMATGDTEGFVKVVADSETGAILGYHVIGHGATELIGEASLGAVLETTPVELGYAVHAHPTLSEALKEAALAVSGEAVHFYTARDRRQGAAPAK